MKILLSKILERSIFSPYTVKHVMPGNRFNFFRDGDRSNIREIDVVINVENRGISKLIAIECKKHYQIKKSKLQIKSAGKN